MISAPIQHIRLNERGVAYIGGTRLKVSHIAIANQTWHKTPEMIQQDYPHLTLGQIHAALGYYWDHREQMDAEIGQSVSEVERLRSEQSSPLSRELLEKRLGGEMEA